MNLSESYKLEFTKCAERAKKLENHSDSVLLLKPGNNRWSAIECLEHLNKSAELYCAQISKALRKYSDLKTSTEIVSFKNRRIVEYLLYYFEPPYKVKIGTFESFKPKLEEIIIDDVFKRFYENQNKYKHLIDESFKLNIKRAKVTSPLTSLVRFRLGEIFPFMAVHQRRHLWQAEKVIELTSREN